MKTRHSELEKQERLAQIEELADKAKMLEAAVNQIANEKAEIWAIVKGTGTAEKSASSSTSVSSRETHEAALPGGKELPGSISGVEADGLTIGAGIDIFEEERCLAEATAEELESLLHRNQSKKACQIARFC